MKENGYRCQKIALRVEAFDHVPSTGLEYLHYQQRNKTFGWMRWNEIGLHETDEPSLRVIIEHCINKESWIITNNRSGKKAVSSSGRDTAKYSKDSENKDPSAHKSEEDVKDKDGIDCKNTEVPESSNIERMELKECINEDGDCSKSSGVAGPENMITAVLEKNEKLEKSLLMELDALKKEMKVESKEMKEQLDALRNEIKQLKEKDESQEGGKREKWTEENRLKSKGWRRLKRALSKYDVSMAGIEAFQRFRFYCVAGHFPWPPHRDEEDDNEEF